MNIKLSIIYDVNVGRMKKMNDDTSKTLEEQLGEDDWAIIIGKDGNLKGLFIPDGADEDEVPDSVVYIMEKFFGMNFDGNDLDSFWDSDYGDTIH